ncbi:MAG: tRNA-specific 2-thiouridylase [Flavobacteriales bacterium]|jgi:tRNA-specific 2-thiouridylase
MKRVVVGLSGGVDSSVAAHLLIEQGYEVIALFMRNWVDDSVIISEECPWIDDSNDALEVAERLGIPYQVIDFSKEYKERIVDYMFAEYKIGRTPNPDILCNREVKFDIFLDKALSLGADYVATGHYCQKETIEVDGKEVHKLIAGADPGKDQSYFLCQLNQHQLSKALFPIGHLQKSKVREIAAEIGLNTAEKKDSQGLCFIGKVKLPTFLQQQLEPKDGDIIELDNNQPQFEYTDSELPTLARNFDYASATGKLVGQHYGAHYFTVGQRKGLNVGGTPEALFVVATDTTKNIVYVGQGVNHKALFRKGLLVQNDDIHWIRTDLEMQMDEVRTYQGRIRYRQPLVGITLHRKPEGLYVVFDEPMSGVTPGQFVAWYEGEESIGSGVIS